MSTTVKRRLNLTVDADVVRAASDAGLNLSQIAERALREATRTARREAWERDHAAGIESYNARVAREGMWSDGLRVF